MSEAEINSIVNKLMERLTPILTKGRDKGEWVTVNYALTHLLSLEGGRHKRGEGLKAIEKAIERGWIERRKRDRKINVKSLYKYLNQN